MKKAEVQPKFDAFLLLLLLFLLVLLLPFLGPPVDDRPQLVLGVEVSLPFSATEFEFEFELEFEHTGVSLRGSWMTGEREREREA